MSSSVLKKQIRRARELHQPLFSTIEITQKCNLRCRHCYNFDRQSGQPVRDKELSLQEIKGVLYDLFELGALSLNITGGEPLSHPHIQEIVRYAKELNFHVRLKTNGTLVTEEFARELFKNGVREFDVSFYGIDEESYVNFTGREGFKKTLEGMVNGKKAGITVTASVILHRQNVEELPQMVKILNHHDISYQISDEITDRYDKTQAFNELSLTEDQYISLLQGPFQHFFECDNKDKNLKCGCAKTVFAVNAFGEIYPCIGSPISCGNIRRDCLIEIWKESPVLNEIRHHKNEDFKDCQRCPLIENCSRSSGSAFINTGEYTGCDPVALIQARARARLKAIKGQS